MTTTVAYTTTPGAPPPALAAERLTRRLHTQVHALPLRRHHPRARLQVDAVPRADLERECAALFDPIGVLWQVES